MKQNKKVRQETTIPAAASDFRKEVLHGLSLPQKAIPSRFLYDTEGSRLFERITELPEYYVTRAEMALFHSSADSIAAHIPPGAAIVEFGSGSSLKAELLLQALYRPRAYVPIDISPSALHSTAGRIKERFPGIEVHPVLGSFIDPAKLVLPPAGGPRVGFFPGSTIGNLAPAEAISFLQSARRRLGPGARFIIGADLQKPLDVLLPAYSDAQGVTAAFNRNILRRINRELLGTFDPAKFEHNVRYNGTEGRIEMHLLAMETHRVRVAGFSFGFRAGETIHTENSYKYTVKGFQALAKAGGWQPLQAWTAGNGLFSVHLLA